VKRVVLIVILALVVTATVLAGVYDVARSVACITGAEDDVAVSASPTAPAELLRSGCYAPATASVPMDEPRITEC
jgi:hypothetical protein